MVIGPSWILCTQFPGQAQQFTGKTWLTMAGSFLAGLSPPNRTSPVLHLEALHTISDGDFKYILDHFSTISHFSSYLARSFLFDQVLAPQQIDCRGQFHTYILSGTHGSTTNRSFAWPCPWVTEVPLPHHFIRTYPKAQHWLICKALPWIPMKSHCLLVNSTHDTMTSPMFDVQHPIWNPKQFDA